MASRSKRRRLVVGDEEPMDVDRRGVFTDKHQLLLQYLMNAQMVKKMELIKIHKKLFNDDESLSDTIPKISSQIKSLKMDIKQVKHEVTGETYYVIFHTTGEFFFPKSCILNKSQLEFLKQVLTGIVLSLDGVIGRIQALNSCKVLSKSDADETIELFIKEKILIETDMGGLCLSPLAVVEFEPFFDACFPENLHVCDLCKQRVFVAKICDGCDLRFHAHCISKWLNSNQSNCPKCKKVWSISMDEDTE